MELNIGNYINHSRYGIGKIISITDGNPRMVKMVFEDKERELELGPKFLSSIKAISDEPIEEIVASSENEEAIQDNDLSNRPIVSFACGDTYNLVNETLVHAHPIRERYPSKVHPYLMVRATGGYSNKLYKVIDTVELNPFNRTAIQQLSSEFDSVKEFIKKSIHILNYQPLPAMYRFYTLEPIHTFNPPFLMKPNPRSLRYLSFPDIGFTSEMDMLSGSQKGASLFFESMANNATIEVSHNSYVDIVASSEDGNLAIKCNYCDGGSNQNRIGFAGICSDSIREYNIDIEKRAWCNNDRCPCFQFHKHRISRQELETIMSTPSNFVCYESTMLTDWKAQAGLTEDEETKRFGPTVHKGAVCVFTTRSPNMAEKDRYVFGLFIIDELFHGNNRKSGYVKCNSKFHIELTPSEAKKIKFWKYYRNRKQPEKEVWGTGLYRFPTNRGIIKLLIDIIAIRDGKSRQEVADFLEEFCRLNRLQKPEIRNTTIEKNIVSFPGGGTYDLVVETGVHAHPVKDGYPSKISPYLMLRGKGGVSEALYRVVDTVEINPLDESAVNKLPAKYDAVKTYINKRKNDYGFSRAPLPYRFYVLDEVYRFNPAFKMANLQGYTYLSFRDVGIFDPETQIQKRLLERKKIEKENQSIEEEIERYGLEGTVRKAVINTRVNQSVFRDLLIRKYGKCCLCGADDQDLLIASHIKPWADSTRKERVDEENGLLLCPNHDKLFDKGYITFDGDGKIVVSPKLSKANRVFFNVNSDMSLNMSPKTKEYMKYHNNHIYRKA